MGWVTMSARLLYIQQELNSIEWQIDQIARQKMNLHKFASTISDGEINVLELAGMPWECLGMATNYLNSSQAWIPFNAMLQARFAFAKIFQTNPNFAQMDPMQSAFLQFAAFKEAKKEAQAEARKSGEALIKLKEEELDYQMKKLEQRQKVLDKEYESVEKRVDKDIERTTPKYA